MSCLHLFRVRTRRSAIPIPSSPMAVERSLQRLVERNLVTFLGVRYLASEYTTSRRHGGRIDTLGLDQRGAPVIIEYKRSQASHLVNQGLFYLDWLLDHRGEFRLLVEDRLGEAAAKNVNWDGSRLVCVAAEFSRYDVLGVRQIQRPVDLVRYRWFAGQLLLLDFVSSPCL